MRGRRVAGIGLAGLVAFGGCVRGDAAARATEQLRDMARGALAQLDGTLELEGVEEPVEVLRDRWGVAHIYARTQHDLFFAQGLVAAQDRLWQMEWWRRYGEGTLSELLGPVAIQHDTFARLLRYRGDPEAEFASYHPQGRGILTAFADGVNAWTRWASERDALPVEFQLTGIEPRPWTAEVPILRMAGLAMTGDNLREIDLARAVAAHGTAEANRRAAPDPWHELEPSPDVEFESIPEDFRQRVLGPSLPAPALLPRHTGWSDLFAPIAARIGGRLGVTERARGAGSNNWVVAGRHSATGAPLLANDPHRAITLPSLRYLVHLNGPGWNVIGAGEPALPGVAIGHNERVGWGLTIVGIDQGDVFVERLDPDDHDRVWHDGDWEPLRIVEEQIDVLGEPSRTVRLKFSHHGPILYEDPDRHLAYALRTVLTEPGTAGYLGSLRVDQARDWDEYLEAMRAWKVPSENMIYADVDGNIGWMAAGLAPLRSGPGWAGRLPVPGDGSHEWIGFRDTMELPSEFNPDRGFITTANHNVMPPGYAPPLGYRWSSPTRYRRLVTVLETGGPFDLEDFKRLQYEVFSSVVARRMERLRGFSVGDETAERARRLLVDWDAVLAADSAAAALYKAWERACREVDADPDRVERGALVATLRAAVATLTDAQGEDWDAWRWGASNRLLLEHPLTDAFDLPPVERSGDRTTVNVGGPQHGASFREILDLADWDASVATSTPGQSGQPEGRFYRDLRRPWAAGEYFPLAFSREAVERVTAHRLLLLPGREEP